MNINFRKQQIPWIMAAGRAALGPLLIAGEACGWNGVALAGVVVTALLSDIFDGVLARRWACDTAAVRLFDSMADTAFYLCAAAALWVGQRGLLHLYAAPLGALLALEAVRFTLDFAKFGRPASYHSYLAKGWGLLMAVGVVGLFGLHRTSPIFSAAMALGIACQLEGLAMSLVLPAWRRDVKTLAAAWALRREMLGLVAGAPVAESAPSMPIVSVPRPGSLIRRRGIVTISAIVPVLLLLAMATPALALDAGQVAYDGGTAGVTQGAAGSFDLASGTTLVFKFHQADGSAAQIAIDYAKIRSYEYQDEVTHHLGVLPAIAVGLVTHRERRYTFAISYADSSDAVQVAIFEVAKADASAFKAVLHARASQLCGNGAFACARAVAPGCAAAAPGCSPAPRTH
jgi:phosphatidylglycerophosphate synthase